LIAVPPEKVEALSAALDESQTLAAIIGEVTAGAAGRIRVLP
jgi:hydrogenase maturation factor